MDSTEAWAKHYTQVDGSAAEADATPEQTITRESESEIEVQIGEAVYLVNLEAEMVFQILPEEKEIGRWDAESRLIVFDQSGPETAAQEEEAPERPPTVLLSVMCPMGTEPGQQLRIETEQGPMEVTVPDGVEPGDTFEAEIVGKTTPNPR